MTAMLSMPPLSLAEKRWPIISMDVMGMDLEDVFLALITEQKTKKKGGK